MGGMVQWAAGSRISLCPGAEGGVGVGAADLALLLLPPTNQPQAGYLRRPRRHGGVGCAPDEEGGGEPQVPTGLQEGDVVQDHPRVSAL